MKKSSFLAGVTLLFASLFTTSCKEIMSNLDQPVSSYLSVSDTSVVLNLDTVYQIKANSINSDKAITYKSSDESIATVDANGLVTPVGNKEGDIEITVSVAASEYYTAGEQKVKIAVKQPLTFEALEDGSIYVNVWSTPSKPIVATKNRALRKEITTSTTIDVKKGDKVQFESTNEAVACPIQPQTKCAVYGNVMSMISPDGNYHTNKTITQPYALEYLLYNAIWDGTKSVAGPTFSHEKYELMVPATKLTNGCYYDMFAFTKITKVPELPATVIPNYAYNYMFQGCGELTEAPAITVDSLYANACRAMFQNCEKLKKANAITVKKAAYQYALRDMFSGCSGLTESPALTVDSIGYRTCYNMFYNCANMTKSKPIKVKETADQTFRYMFYNCSGLTESPAITADSLGNYACRYMFDNCNKLATVNAINVKIMGPSAFYMTFSSKPELTTVVAVNAEKVCGSACYQMFSYNEKLENVPAILPAKTLEYRCYSDMFAGCKVLKKAPALPAENLASYCYNYMFGGCTALTEAPELKAATLADNCYNNMFSGCSKLNKVVCLATTNATDALGYWLNGAGTDASVTKRTLIRAEANTQWTNYDYWSWGTANWYVPTGWDIEPGIPN